MRRLLLALGLLCATGAQAARPFVTDDARVVDPGGCQLETFSKQQRGFREREFWFLPACNRLGVEFTVGGNWIRSEMPGDTRAAIVQGKFLLRPLQTDGHGFAMTLGALRQTPFSAPAATSPYLNGIGSFSFAGDRVVLHANLGALRDNVARISRGTWGVGAEVLLSAPRWYGILETYGQTGEKPTLHGGLRVWLVPNRVQVDTTVGLQDANPDRRFATVGLRMLW